MILGIGLDIIEIGSIQKRLEHEQNKFKDIVFQQEEIEYCDKYKSSAQHYAGRYAAKEAARKALGLPKTDEMNLKQICISRTSFGQPIIKLFGETFRKVEQLGDLQIQLSISHSRSHAIALVVAEKK